jgi:hypothetical protein
VIRFRRMLHRLLDPVGSLPNHLRAWRVLRDLPDGEYRAQVPVPYVSQFATPALIHDYIHARLHGRDDPAWESFGAPDVETYTFWAHRACAIACLKMAIDGFASASPRSLWALVDQGLQIGGYTTYTQSGVFLDEGWYYPALVTLAESHGLEPRGLSYISPWNLCSLIRDGWLIAAAVTPDLGEYGPLQRYDGHFALVFGFTWARGRLQSVLIHNPSGRYPELQAGAVIPAERFARAFAYRGLALRPK